MALLRKASKEVAKSAVIKNKELLVENQEDQNTVPDLSNLTLRDVIRRVRGKNIQLKISGKGTVSEIIPSAGEPLPTDRKIKVILEQ
jgi:cell division protein FtsI (penicillin-binding protein 3)